MDEYHKAVTVRLSAKEAHLLSELQEYYNLPTYADVIRMCLQRVHSLMKQEQQEERKSEH